MQLNTNLQGRLRNTFLPAKNGLMALFEAVVNSIHSLEDIANNNEKYVTITINRHIEEHVDPDYVHPIIGFEVTDNGVGFNEANFKSFQTLDSDHKEAKGCRGIGRLLWLKAFKQVGIRSCYLDEAGEKRSREFDFSAAHITPAEESPCDCGKIETKVILSDYIDSYRQATTDNALTIAQLLLEHCLWYFLRDGGVPDITIVDGPEHIKLDNLYQRYVLSSAQTADITVHGETFSIIHTKLRATKSKQHKIFYCAQNRVVVEEPLNNKIPGLFGSLQEGGEPFCYLCFVSGDYFDKGVKPERTGFNIPKKPTANTDLFGLSFSEINDYLFIEIKRHLEQFLEENIALSSKRVDDYVSKSARYKSVAGLLVDDLNVDPDISDQKLELLLHKQYTKVEADLIKDGQTVLDPSYCDTIDEYKEKISTYMSKVSEFKKSTLATYIAHRRAVLDLLSLAISKREDEKYPLEEVVHSLIMPMQKTSSNISARDNNLWLLSERLAYHDYLASDKTLSSMPITGDTSNKEPDIIALNVYDEPLLVNDKTSFPLASITIVELKRPMRNVLKDSSGKGPIEQALGYLEKVRNGKVKTKHGRLIPEADSIPGFCYVVADLTPTMRTACKNFALQETADKTGYFGYNHNYKAYIEVLSYDSLLQGASERNRAFFDKLGLPHADHI